MFGYIVNLLTTSFRFIFNDTWNTVCPIEMIDEFEESHESKIIFFRFNVALLIVVNLMNNNETDKDDLASLLSTTPLIYVLIGMKSR